MGKVMEGFFLLHRNGKYTGLETDADRKLFRWYSFRLYWIGGPSGVYWKTTGRQISDPLFPRGWMASFSKQHRDWGSVADPHCELSPSWCSSFIVPNRYHAQGLTKKYLGRVKDILNICHVRSASPLGSEWRTQSWNEKTKASLGSETKSFLTAINVFTVLVKHGDKQRHCAE